MKKISLFFITALTLSFHSQAIASLNVFACEPEWASLADELGGERIKSYSATHALQDPHHIQARPSLIAKVRQADLLICSGADLEVGWLPLLLRKSGNKQVRPGNTGYFEAALAVERLDIPRTLNRSMGDVHAAGNPHVHLDPRRVLIIAKVFSERLIKLDPQGKNHYLIRYKQFEQRWQQSIKQWEEKAKPLNGSRIVVHHRDWVYLFNWLGIKIAGALEPKPGLPTSASHLMTLKKSLTENPASMIVFTPHQNSRGAKRLSSLLNIPAIELPYTVGGSKRTQDLFALFDEIINTLTEHNNDQ